MSGLFQMKSFKMLMHEMNILPRRPRNGPAPRFCLSMFSGTADGMIG